MSHTTGQVVQTEEALFAVARYPILLPHAGRPIARLVVRLRILSILRDPSTCKECNQSGKECPRPIFPGEAIDDCDSLSATPKTSNLWKSSKTSKEAKIQEILPSGVDSNTERWSWSEVPKDVDSNEGSWSWTDIVKNFRSENSGGGRNQSSN